MPETKVYDHNFLKDKGGSVFCAHEGCGQVRRYHYVLLIPVTHLEAHALQEAIDAWIGSESADKMVRELLTGKLPDEAYEYYKTVAYTADDLMVRISNLINPYCKERIARKLKHEEFNLDEAFDDHAE